MLIGITGPAFSGKGTIANHLCWTHGYTCEAFADPLRDGLFALFGLLPHHLKFAASIVIPDVRFVDEAQLIHSHGGVIWRVIRPGAETTAHSDHTSEQEQQRIVADVELINDGTIQELQRAVDTALRALESDPHSPRFVAA